MNAPRPLRLGLVAPPISGHLNPALAVARELRDRGHDVVAYGLPDARDKVEASGVEFHPVGGAVHPEGTVPAWMYRQGQLTGVAAMRWILGCLQKENLAYMQELPGALGRRPVDALLLDQLSYGAASVAQHHSLPYVTLCNALPVHLDTTVPPFAMTWSPLRAPLESLRSYLATLPLRPLFSRHLRPLNALRRAWSLPPLRPETLGDSPLAILSQQPVGFEFPQRRMPDHFHLTGPWFREDTRKPEPFPYERLDRRPLVYASMGTLQNRIASVFRTIAEACAPLDVQLVLALGTRDA
ncbi:MAG: glycosyltransferase, partial [Verrucomicrobiales bacterium]|nr:glycosyltransferase [Verrucomicrobiales bacterium]